MIPIELLPCCCWYCTVCVRFCAYQPRGINALLLYACWCLVKWQMDVLVVVVDVAAAALQQHCLLHANCRC